MQPWNRMEQKNVKLVFLKRTEEWVKIEFARMEGGEGCRASEYPASPVRM